MSRRRSKPSRTQRLVSAITIASALGVLPAQQADAAPQRTTKVSVQVSEDASGFLAVVNENRAAEGLAPLQLVADRRVQGIVQRVVDSQHQGLLHSTTCDQELRDAGCAPVGEILAAGGVDTMGAEAAGWWQASQGHRDLLMAPKARLVTFAIKTEKVWIEDGEWSRWSGTRYYGAHLISECTQLDAPVVERRGRSVRR